MLFRSPYGLNAQHIIIQATTNSPCNLTWEKAKLACSDQKTPIQPQIVHDLQCWSEASIFPFDLMWLIIFKTIQVYGHTNAIQRQLMDENLMVTEESGQT